MIIYIEDYKKWKERAELEGLEIVINDNVDGSDSAWNSDHSQLLGSYNCEIGTGGWIDIKQEENYETI